MSVSLVERSPTTAPGGGDPRLDEGRLRALQNLSKRQQGHDVGFINIADARALTELGFALRTPQGWQITESGAGVLAQTS
jgi:hypothetical protein